MKYTLAYLRSSSAVRELSAIDFSKYSDNVLLSAYKSRRRCAMMSVNIAKLKMILMNKNIIIDKSYHYDPE